LVTFKSVPSAWRYAATEMRGSGRTLPGVVDRFDYADRASLPARSRFPESRRNENLLAQPETLKQRAISIVVGAAQIIQKLAATAHHTQQTTAGVMILDVALEMASEIVDARRQQRNLHFRGSGIGRGPLMILQNLSLLARRNRHSRISERKAGSLPADPSGFQVFLWA